MWCFLDNFIHSSIFFSLFFEACLLLSICKAAFTGESVRIAVALHFLPLFPIFFSLPFKCFRLCEPASNEISNEMYKKNIQNLRFEIYRLPNLEAHKTRYINKYDLQNSDRLLQMQNENFEWMEIYLHCIKWENDLHCSTMCNKNDNYLLDDESVTDAWYSWQTATLVSIALDELDCVNLPRVPTNPGLACTTGETRYYALNVKEIQEPQINFTTQGMWVGKVNLFDQRTCKLQVQNLQIFFRCRRCS